MKIIAKKNAGHSKGDLSSQQSNKSEEIAGKNGSTNLVESKWKTMQIHAKQGKGVIL